MLTLISCRHCEHPRTKARRCSTKFGPSGSPSRQILTANRPNMTRSSFEHSTNPTSPFNILFSASVPLRFKPAKKNRRDLHRLKTYNDSDELLSSQLRAGLTFQRLADKAGAKETGKHAEKTSPSRLNVARCGF